MTKPIYLLFTIPFIAFNADAVKPESGPEDVNVINKGSMSRIPLKPPIYQAKQIMTDPTDKAFTKVCSYMPDCDYNKDITIDYNVNLNKDTFIEKYSSIFDIIELNVGQ